MHTMTEQEMLLAERAADTLVDLIRSLESRDPNHPEIAALNKLYGEILHAMFLNWSRSALHSPGQH